MLKDRETRDCEVAPTGALRRFPPGVLPTRVLSRLIRLWWRPVELPHSARPITISIANFASLQAGGKSRPIASAISLQLQQNCSKIAVELHQNCTRIAPELQQKPSNCTQLQQNHIGVGGGDPQHEANQPGGTAIWRNRVAKPPGPNSVLTSTPPCFRTVDNLSCPG